MMISRTFAFGFAARLVSLVGLAVLAAGTTGRATSSGDETERGGLGAETSLPARQGALVIDGCVLATWYRSTLALPSTKRLVREVILLCLIPRLDGTVGPRDPSARQQLANLAQDLRSEGYRVHLGVAFTDESGQRYDGAQTRAFISD